MTDHNYRDISCWKASSWAYGKSPKLKKTRNPKSLQFARSTTSQVRSGRHQRVGTNLENQKFSIGCLGGEGEPQVRGMLTLGPLFNLAVSEPAPG